MFVIFESRECLLNYRKINAVEGYYGRHEGMRSHKVGVMFMQLIPSITDWEKT